MKILITGPFEQEYIKILQEEHVVYVRNSDGNGAMNESEINAILKETNAEIFICESETIGESALEGVENLKMISVCRAGLNKINIPFVLGRGITLTNTPGRNSSSVAELIVYLTIALTRSFDLGSRKIRENQWDDPSKLYFSLRGHELSGKLMGFLGFGAVPRETVKRLSSFNMKFYAYDPYVTQKQADDYGVTMVELDDIFKSCDFVSNNLPDTKETKGFVDAQKIAMMKSTAYFINTGRAATVVEEDMISALENNKIAGAAFDVYNAEPIPNDHPYLTFDNVVLIPHLGGASLDVVKNHSKMVIEDINTFINGDKPKHKISIGD